MGEWTARIEGVPEILDQFGYGPDDKDLPTVTRELREFLEGQTKWTIDREYRSVIEDLEIFEGEDDVAYFDLIMNALYDWADRMRVWIEPIPKRTTA